MRPPIDMTQFDPVMRAMNLMGMMQQARGQGLQNQKMQQDLSQSPQLHQLAMQQIQQGLDLNPKKYGLDERRTALDEGRFRMEEAMQPYKEKIAGVAAEEGDRERSRAAMALLGSLYNSMAGMGLSPQLALDMLNQQGYNFQLPPEAPNPMMEWLKAQNIQQPSK